ncbi:MAG: hypothetical protein U0903_11910 [Planctomycetales bacterium]
MSQDQPAKPVHSYPLWEWVVVFYVFATLFALAWPPLNTGWIRDNAEPLFPLLVRWYETTPGFWLWFPLLSTACFVELLQLARRLMSERGRERFPWWGWRLRRQVIREQWELFSSLGLILVALLPLIVVWMHVRVDRTYRQPKVTWAGPLVDYVGPLAVFSWVLAIASFILFIIGAQRCTGWRMLFGLFVLLVINIWVIANLGLLIMYED